MSGRLVFRTVHWPRSQFPLKINQYGRASYASLSSGASSGTRQSHIGNALRTLTRPQKLVQTILVRRRSFLTESVPSILVPPVVFAGLLLALWTWKCLMMVLFQDKIIYMPSMPPFARSEKMDEYTPTCKPVQWTRRDIKSLDGTNITLCVGKLHGLSRVTSESTAKEVVVCYFQGNGSSLPPRLPILSNVLKSVAARASDYGIPIRYTVIALSYRGYWTSSGRASQAGIELDAQALLSYVAANLAGSGVESELILWGQSIGSGVATTAAAKYMQHGEKALKISALILETPFTSVKSMLIALYPQKWLPYRYLWPFLWNRWDSETALRQIALYKRSNPKVLILPATRDEVVPPEEAEKLEKLCSDLKYDYERRNVVGALHSEATVRRDGQEAIAKFIADVVRSK